MFKIIVTENYDELSEKAFEVMKEVITSKSNPVLGLATGSSPIGLYQNMIKDHKENGTSYKNVVTFNLDEYIGLKRDHSQTYWTFMAWTFRKPMFTFQSATVTTSRRSVKSTKKR